MNVKIMVALTGCLAALTGCNHKDISYDYDPATAVRVVYDWRNAPEANPASMALYMFDTRDSRQPALFSFSGRDGGMIHLPYTTYTALCLNNDITDWAVMGREFDSSAQSVHTRPTSRLEGYGLPVTSIPRATGAEQEAIVDTPGMFWCDRADNIDVKASADTTVITLYPSEGVCHYTVDFINVKNIESLHGNLLDATLSGLADGYITAQAQPSGTPATMPFTLAPVPQNASLHGQFLTFGEADSPGVRHQLSVYMYITDGTRWHYTVDVTQQVHNAPDPRNVHIIIDGLELPKPITGGGGGFIPDVNDWNTINIGVDMHV